MAKILYLEDEAWQVKSTVITFMERELGHQVTLVETIVQAQEKLATTPWDVVFLDIMMNVRKGLIEFEDSGLQIAQSILEGQYAPAGNPAHLPIIIASGVWDATVRDAAGHGWTVEDRARALGIPRRHFLRKPFLVDEVRAVLTTALRPNEE